MVILGIITGEVTDDHSAADAALIKTVIGGTGKLFARTETDQTAAPASQPAAGIESLEQKAACFLPCVRVICLYHIMDRVADRFLHGFPGIDPVKFRAERLSGREGICLSIYSGSGSFIYNFFIVVKKSSEPAAQFIQVKTLQYFVIVVDIIMAAGCLEHGMGSVKRNFFHTEILYRKVQCF